MIPLRLLPLLAIPTFASVVPIYDHDDEADDAPAVIRRFILSPTLHNTTESLLAGTECRITGYYGAYGRPLQHIYGLSDACAGVSYHWPGKLSPEEALLDMPDEEYDFPMRYNPDVPEEALFWEWDPAPETPTRFVWLEDSGLDASLRTQRFADSMFDMEIKAAELWNSWEATGYWTTPSDDQHPLGPGQEVPNLGRAEAFYRDKTGALMAIEESKLAHLDWFLPPGVSAVLLPTEPYALTDVPEKAAARVRNLIKKLRFNPDIASIVSTLSIDIMRRSIRHLSGEDGQGILSRHSFNPGARLAADWIQQQLEFAGATCYQKGFLEGYSPNVICRYEGTSNPNTTVLLSAHYDSRGSFGNTRAPGANDDGSGTVHLLAVARAIKDNQISFKSSVEICAFAGEEQGLRGSYAYARELSEKGVDVALMIQADMLAYHSPLEPPQLGLPDLIGLPEAAWLVANISKIYSPELTIGSTPACCSDHQSFHRFGFPATQVYERAGPIIDPMYHNSGDVSDRVGYDLQQVRSIAKVTFATILEAAGFEWDDSE